MFLKVCDGVGACCREKAVRLFTGVHAGMVRIVGRKEDSSIKGAEEKGRNKDGSERLKEKAAGKWLARVPPKPAHPQGAA